MEKLLLESFESMYHSHITHLRSIVGRGCYVDSRVIDKITISIVFLLLHNLLNMMVGSYIFSAIKLRKRYHQNHLSAETNFKSILPLK